MWEQHFSGFEVVLVNDGSTDARGYALYVEAINELLTHRQLWCRRFRYAPLAHPSVMYRKEVVLGAGGYSQEAVPENYELWLRLFVRGHCFAKLPDILLCWNDHETRLSRTHPNYYKKAFWGLKAKFFAKWLKSGLLFPLIPEKEVKPEVSKGCTKY